MIFNVDILSVIDIDTNFFDIDEKKTKNFSRYSCESKIYY